MTYRNKSRKTGPWTAVSMAVLLAVAGDGLALESDRQQPLEIRADDTDGSLGDGTTVLSGRVEIRQGTLFIEAARAEVEKSDGKVRTIRFLGQPATLEQEIEEQGLVQAEANTITYKVGAGIVELAGAADVTHPQYQISGELLTYDLDRQHFEGTGSSGSAGDSDGRIRIQLEPEVAADLQDAAPQAGAQDGGAQAGVEAGAGAEAADTRSDVSGEEADADEPGSTRMEAEGPEDKRPEDEGPEATGPDDTAGDGPG